MDYAKMIKARVENAAQALLRELEVSHGVEGLSISVKETAKSITVTLREAQSGSDDPEPDESEPVATDDPLDENEQ